MLDFPAVVDHTFLRFPQNPQNVDLDRFLIIYYIITIMLKI